MGRIIRSDTKRRRNALALSARRNTLVAGIALAIGACGGDNNMTEPPPDVDPPPPTTFVPARITIEPAEVAVVAGDTIRVKASVFNDLGRPIADAEVSFSSSNPAVATVDTTGLVTGIREGDADIMATSGSVQGAAAATVQSVDRATLLELLDATDGNNWTNLGVWGSIEPLGSWYGVETNADGRVTSLHLSENGLQGQLPASLGELAFLTDLRVDGNDLSGPIPISLSKLKIQQFWYGGTMLCTLRGEEFHTWLNAIPKRDGEAPACDQQREDLLTLFRAWNGPRWGNWSTDTPLRNWVGITLNSAGRVIEIDLNRKELSGTIPPEIQYFPYLRLLRLDYNSLRGRIPPEIGKLTELRRLDLDGNHFTGPIPPEFGNLIKLEVLWMGSNGMSGPIPPEFGKLASLKELHLYEAGFDGSIPEEFGALAELRLLRIQETRITGPVPATLGELEKLRRIFLRSSRLTGPLPAELGQIDSLTVINLTDNIIDGPIPGGIFQPILEDLFLGSNKLSGSLPPELARAKGLETLRIDKNPDLAGSLPYEITELTQLQELIAGNTGLCAPRNRDFQDWLDAVVVWRVRLCGIEGPAEAYLIQSTQSRDYPVPLVAGKGALLRVFVMSEAATSEFIPPVRGTFFVDGAETYSVNIPAGSSAIPTEIQVGELDLSANAEIPAEVIQPGLEMVIEVDPDGTVDPALGVAKRIPAEGRTPVAVRELPPMYLTLVPFVSTPDDRAAEVFVNDAREDDEFFSFAQILLPVGTFELRKHPSVMVDSNNIFHMLAEMSRIRMIEAGTGHWAGFHPDVAGALGVANLGSHPNPNHGKVSVSMIRPWVFAHELGHNLNLLHTACSGDEANTDSAYPYEGGKIGLWGYDPRGRDGGSLVPPDSPELMSYCRPDQWISDYTYTNALRFRMRDPHEVRRTAASQILIVAGGAAEDGTLHLDPAFVVETTPVLPQTGGPYELAGRRTDGSELFSVAFDMQMVQDGDGRSGFAFALPMQTEWASELESLRLSGPAGSVEIREGSEPPMAIMRDPVTGHVRAILRDLPQGVLAARAAAEALAPEPGLEIMLSTGLPNAADWR